MSGFFRSLLSSFTTFSKIPGFCGFFRHKNLCKLKVFAEVGHLELPPPQKKYIYVNFGGGGA